LLIMKPVLCACALLLLPELVLAQAAPLVDLRAAFGASHYLHGDLDFNAPTLLVAVRVGAEHVAIEPEIAVAWHSTTERFTGTPSGTVTQTTFRRFQSAGVNLIGRWNGRVAPFVGGGIGLYLERRKFENSIDMFELGRTFGPRPGLQATGGVDVRVTPRVRAFGQMRYEMRSFQDPGGGSVLQGLGGMAIGVW
jgi:hypothetical protein